MKFNKLNIIYFSATNTTKKIVRAIAKGIEAEQIEEFNLTHAQVVRNIEMGANDLLLFAMPSYSGRVPFLVSESLSYLRGDNTPAIIACAYGNREYDDTLIEMRDIVVKYGFKVISAGAFVAQHSIFPTVATGRPNAEDLEEAKVFGQKSVEQISRIDALSALPIIQVQGNAPYRGVGKIPLRPTGNRKCDACGICARLCPTHAIDEKTPRKTDKAKCIACGHCITVCPQDARAYRGLIYAIASRKFTKSYSRRKENEFVFVK